MLIELGEYEEALLWADKALELFPEHPDLLASKAVASTRTGDLEKAMAYTDNALSQKGATPYVWLARAEALLERGSATATHCVSNAVAAAGNSAPRVELEAGRTLLRAGHCAQALGHLRKAVGLLPGSALAWLELGRCQAALGFPEAAMTLSQCLTLRPDWPPARGRLDRFQRRGLLSRVQETSCAEAAREDKHADHRGDGPDFPAGAQDRGLGHPHRRRAAADLPHQRRDHPRQRAAALARGHASASSTAC